MLSIRLKFNEFVSATRAGVEIMRITYATEDTVVIRTRAGTEGDKHYYTDQTIRNVKETLRRQHDSAIETTIEGVHIVIKKDTDRSTLKVCLGSPDFMLNFVRGTLLRPGDVFANTKDFWVDVDQPTFEKWLKFLCDHDKLSDQGVGVERLAKSGKVNRSAVLTRCMLQDPYAMPLLGGA
jgi:hypothetical protein